MRDIGKIPAIRYHALMIALVIVLRFPALLLPVIDTDEAGHGVCARELLAGGRLYVDYADNKPPLLYWIFAVLLWIGGGSTLAVHWFNLFWILAGAWGIKRMLQSGGSGEVSGRWAFLAYVVGSSVYLPNDMLASNGEQLMNPFLVFSVLAWWLPGPAFSRGLISGISGIAGGLCYQKGWIVLPVLLVWAIVTSLRDRSGARHVFSYLVGLFFGAAAITMVVAALLLRTGSLAPSIHWNFLSNASYIQSGLGIVSFSLEDHQPHGLVRVLFYLLAILLPLRVIWSGLRSRHPMTSRQASLASFLLLWLGASFLALSLGGRYFGHYFLQIVPAWSGLFGLFLPGVWERKDRPGRRGLLYSGIPLAGLTLFAYVWLAIGGLESQKPILHAVADHARRNSSVDARIFVWGYASPVYYYSGRQPAGRFVYPQTLAGYVPGNPHSMNPDSDHWPDVVWENWPILMADLRQKKPALIYDFSPSGFHYWGKYRMEDYPLFSLVDSCYAPCDTILNVVAYKRILPDEKTEDNGRG